MAGTFERFGVTVVAISSDGADDVLKHRRRDGLASLTLLADPTLAAIDALGLRRPKGLPFKTFYVFGVPLGIPTRTRDLAIPTSILIDENGIVQWIDQADDYRLRGDAQRIESALERAFGTAKQPTA